MHFCLDGGDGVEPAVDELHVERFGFKVIEDPVLASESAVHEESVQVGLQIVEPVQHNKSHPDCVEGPEIVVAGTGHRNETELAEGLKEEAVRNPDAGVSDE